MQDEESRLLDTFLADQIQRTFTMTKILEIHNEQVSLNQQIKDAKAKSTPGFTLEPTQKCFLEASRAMKDLLTPMMSKSVK